MPKISEIFGIKHEYVGNQQLMFKVGCKVCFLTRICNMTLTRKKKLLFWLFLRKLKDRSLQLTQFIWSKCITGSFLHVYRQYGPQCLLIDVSAWLSSTVFKPFNLFHGF